MIHRTSKEPLQSMPSMMANLWEALDILEKLKTRVRRTDGDLTWKAVRIYQEHVDALGRAVRHRVERRISRELNQLFN
jgi:hypothetical protein